VAKTKLTLGLCALGGLAAASSFSHTLDEAICWLIGGSIAVGGAGYVVAHFVGEAQLEWECRRPDPKQPMAQPWYWSQARKEDMPRWSIGHGACR